MRLWFARDSGISMREQLVTQVMLGILCDELAPGQRLPSTRELARRFKAARKHDQRGLAATTARGVGRTAAGQRRVRALGST